MKKKNIINVLFYLFLIIFRTNYIQAEINSDIKSNDRYSNILLVVHYNHPYYDSIPFIEKLYSDVFPNIVFFGEKIHPKVNVIPTHFGYEFSKVVADALNRFPEYDGYIFLQDDCFMNVWNYERLDLNKIWYASPRFQVADMNDPSTYIWWFNSPWGIPALQIALPHLSNTEKNQLEKNHGINKVGGYFCDMFYIPKRYADQTQRLAQIFQNVFCEISIPTILSCMEDKNEWEQLNEQYGLDSLDKYDPKYDWAHPIKFSSPKAQEFIMQQMKYHSQSNVEYDTNEK